MFIGHGDRCLLIVCQFKKKLPACKPDSVSPDKSGDIYHLSAIPVARHLLRSTPLPCPAEAEPSREQRFRTDIRELSIRKVCPYTNFHWHTVSSYLTFSPLSRRVGTVIFCGTFSLPKFLSGCPEVIGMRCSVLSGLSFPYF